MKLQRAIYETLTNGFILMLQFLVVVTVSTAVVVPGSYIIYLVDKYPEKK